MQCILQDTSFKTRCPLPPEICFYGYDFTSVQIGRDYDNRCDAAVSFVACMGDGKWEKCVLE